MMKTHPWPVSLCIHIAARAESPYTLERDGPSPLVGRGTMTMK